MISDEVNLTDRAVCNSSDLDVLFRVGGSCDPAIKSIVLSKGNNVPFVGVKMSILIVGVFVK